MAKIYVTDSLVKDAYKAKAIDADERRYLRNAKRKDRNKARFRELTAKVRAWADARSCSPSQPDGGAAVSPRPANDTADRVAALVAGRNEIGDIPPIANPARRESCRLDLELFGWTYCRSLLNHRASDIIRERLVAKMQDAILYGGQLAVQFTRGAGKTTWEIIALTWALLYGHRCFPVYIAASRPLAKATRKGVLDLLAESPEIFADFPAVPTALRKMNGVVQKGAVLTYHGRNVGFETSEVALILPDLRDDNGKPLDCACGAIIACRGIGASIRGLNFKGRRPDFVMFDDPQTQKDAASATAVARLDKYIHSDALNLSANTDTMAAFLTITPQTPDDLAMRIADRSIHPNWSVTSCPFLVKIPDGFDELADVFAQLYATDAANDDFTRSASRGWYRENREKFKDVEVVDPLAFDKATEIDAVHHALNRMAAIGRSAFDAEYQMSPVREGTAFEISDRLILSRVRNGSMAGAVPPEAVLTVCATDINPSYALTSAIVSFDVRLTAQVVAYRTQRIRIPDAIPDAEFSRLVYEKLAEHGRLISEWGIRIDRWGIDAGGKQFDAATLFAPNAFELVGMNAIPMLGRAGQNWNPNVRSRIREARNSTVQCRDAEGRFWLAWNADEYKERAQKAWLPAVGAPGGLTLFDGRVSHAGFAAQIANEKIKTKTKARTFDGRDRWVYKWDTKDPHDYGDCVAMCYALAGADGLTGTSTPNIRRRGRYVIE